MSIETETKVDLYEIDGIDVDYKVGEKRKVIEVLSHWNYSDRVGLKIGGKVYTVIASELQTAIENATNG